MRRKKAAEKERANQTDAQNKLKLLQTAGVTTNAGDWNADGTPKPSAIAKMGDKERLYWTEATPRARVIADKCGVLCLDIEAEDYVEAKLEDIFKLTPDDKKILADVKADVPLDTDAKFTEDSVFMADTLEKIIEYQNYIMNNEDEVRTTIKDRIIEEYVADDRYFMNGAGNVARALNEAELKWDELQKTVEAWKDALEKNDSDLLVLDGARELDEKISGFKSLNLLPSAIIDIEFGKRLSELDKAFNEYKSTALDIISKNELYKDIFQPLGLTPDNVYENRFNFSDILMVALHPDVTAETATYLFNGATAPVIAYRTNMTMFSSVDSNKFFDVASSLRDKYSLFSKSMRSLVTVPQRFAPARTRYSGGDMESNIMGSETYDSNRDSMIFRNAASMSEIDSVVKGYAKKVDSNDNATQNILNRIHTTASFMKDSANVLTAHERAFELLSESIEPLSHMYKVTGAIKIPDSLTGFKQNMNGYNTNSRVNEALVDYKKMKESLSLSRKSRQKYRLTLGEKSFIEYSQSKRDMKYGGMGASSRANEVYGETSAMKGSIRHAWSKHLTTLNTWNSGGSANDGLAFQHSGASLAVAVGLNWQVRKMVKKDKIIPEWKWYEGTKPFSADNKFSAKGNAYIYDTTIHSKGRRGNHRYTNSSGNDKYSFKEDTYAELLTTARESVLATEAGLTSGDKSAHPSPRIALKTQAGGVARFVQEIKDKWTHQNDPSFKPSDYVVHHVFDILYPDYKKAHDEVKAKLGNTTIQFSSTDFQSGAKIIKGGFKFTPIRNGNMLGIPKQRGVMTDRIYHTYSSSKTLQYLAKSFDRNNGHGVMFRCEVAMGKTNSPSDLQRAIRDKSFNTVSAYGRVLPGGGYRPNNSGVDHDEIAVKNPLQSLPLQWIDVGRIKR